MERKEKEKNDSARNSNMAGQPATWKAKKEKGSKGGEWK